MQLTSLTGIKVVLAGIAARIYGIQNRVKDVRDVTKINKTVIHLPAINVGGILSSQERRVHFLVIFLYSNLILRQISFCIWYK